VSRLWHDLQVKLADAPRDDPTSPGRSRTFLSGTCKCRGRYTPGANGWVTLDGEVGYDYQRREVERMVRQVRGVIGGQTPSRSAAVSPQKVQEVIEDAFKREAEVDARHISVGVSDHTAKLYGHVHSVTRPPRPGGGPRRRISAVESHLVVSP